MTVLTSEQGTEGDPSPPSPSTAPPPPTHTTTCPGSREQAGHPPVQVLQLPAVPAGSGGRLPIPRGAFGPPPPPPSISFPRTESGNRPESDSVRLANGSGSGSDSETGPGLGGAEPRVETKPRRDQTGGSRRRLGNGTEG